MPSLSSLPCIAELEWVPVDKEKKTEKETPAAEKTEGQSAEQTAEAAPAEDSADAEKPAAEESAVFPKPSEKDSVRWLTVIP